jgi:hypothetical protein
MKQQFKARLAAHGPGGAWTFLYIPFSPVFMPSLSAL